MSTTATIVNAKDVERIEMPDKMGNVGILSVTPERICGDLFFKKGDGFNFHHHPRQEEIIYVTDGRIEAWLEREKAILGAGDFLVAPPGTIHACFNVEDETAKVFVVLSPTLEDAEDGWEMVDVGGDEPWSSLRT